MDTLAMDIDRDKRELDPVQDSGTQEKIQGKSLHSEVDLSERDEHLEEYDDEHKHVDYSDFTKAQLVNVIKELSRENNLKRPLSKIGAT